MSKDTDYDLTTETKIGFESNHKSDLGRLLGDRTPDEVLQKLGRVLK